MDDFDTAQSHAGTAKVLESEHRTGASFNGSTAQLDNVVQVPPRGTDPGWISMVLDNHDPNQAPSEQRVMEGDRKFDASEDGPSMTYRNLAGLMVPNGFYVDDAERWAQHGTKHSPQLARRPSQ